jgi:2-iminobutanoate/2-iminopropanoate deaminase
MKHSLFYSVAIIAIFFLLYLNFAKSNKRDAAVDVIQTDNAPQPIGPYSQAVRRGNAFFVSGQIAIDPKTGALDTSSITTETKRVMENIKAIITASGLTMNDIAKTSIFMTDLKNFSTVNDIYTGYFGAGPYPARETVQVAALPKGVHIEISVTAIKQ